jgi:hypothetical protein
MKNVYQTVAYIPLVICENFHRSALDLKLSYVLITIPMFEFQLTSKNVTKELLKEFDTMLCGRIEKRVMVICTFCNYNKSVARCNSNSFTR